jgi:hypothetical protein
MQGGSNYPKPGGSITRNRAIGQIWRYGRFVDADVAALISEIESSQYSQILKHMGRAYVNNANLSFFAGAYFEIFGTAMRLAKCAEKLRKQYGIAPTGGG